jgi:hypothetical protein
MACFCYALSRLLTVTITTYACVCLHCHYCCPLQSTLEYLQIPTDAVVRTQATPIGKGGFAKVYKAQFKGQDCATKVCNNYSYTFSDVTLPTVTHSTEPHSSVVIAAAAEGTCHSIHGACELVCNLSHISVIRARSRHFIVLIITPTLTHCCCCCYVQLLL